jgi:hypothetical protein
MISGSWEGRGSSSAELQRKKKNGRSFRPFLGEALQQREFGILDMAQPKRFPKKLLQQ